MTTYSVSCMYSLTDEMLYAPIRAQAVAHQITIEDLRERLAKGGYVRCGNVIRDDGVSVELWRRDRNSALYTGRKRHTFYDPDHIAIWKG